jgi:hypothetical protein
MKMLRLCLGLLFVVGCAHPTGAPVPVTAAAARPAAPPGGAPPAKAPAGAPPAQAPAGAPLEPLPSARIFIGCGFLLAQNHGTTAFSVVLPAATPKQSQYDPSVVLLDGVLVKTGVTTAGEIGAPKLRGYDLLRRQMSWQADRVASTHGWPKLKPEGEPFDLGLEGDVKVWFWGLDAPEPFEVEGVKVNRVAYVTAAVDDVVLTLASPLRPEDDPGPVARVMSRAMRSLRRSPSPIDVFAVQETALAGKLDPAFCARVGPS